MMQLTENRLDKIDRIIEEAAYNKMTTDGRAITPHLNKDIMRKLQGSTVRSYKAEGDKIASNRNVLAKELLAKRAQTRLKTAPEATVIPGNGTQGAGPLAAGLGAGGIAALLYGLTTGEDQDISNE